MAWPGFDDGAAGIGGAAVCRGPVYRSQVRSVCRGGVIEEEVRENSCWRSLDPGKLE